MKLAVKWDLDIKASPAQRALNKAKLAAQQAKLLQSKVRVKGLH